jgi:Arc/MetJ-type ribon-helix-helix transcriptional regulator
MNIALPPHIQRFIEQEVASGRFADEQQVIVTALEWMAGDRRIDPDVLQELIAEPLAQLARGEVREVTEELMDELVRQATINAERGHQVPDDVKY